jgi:cytochrome c oxidase subunit 2
MNFTLLLASGKMKGMSIFDPASPPAESIFDLSILVLAITGAIFVIVEGVLFYCVLRFRRGAQAGTEPPQVYGSKPIEIAWTAAPALIVFILVLVTTRTLWEVKADPPAPHAGDHALFITIVGRQWWWEYTYESYKGEKLGFTTANELHIPVSEKGISRPVYLTLKSADVCHSFWIPKLGGKTDLIPGHPNNTWFMTDRTGLFFGQCAEYCGTQHANMLIRLFAEPADDFEQWLKHEREPAADESQAHTGRGAFLSQSCVNCHRIRGTTAQGTFGPDLTHLMSRKSLAAGMIPNTPENLHAWVADPQEIKPGCLMPAFGLSENDRDQIVRYLSTLR